MIMRRLFGIVFMSMGFGVFIVLIIPGWAYIFAAALIIFGFWNLFMC